MQIFICCELGYFLGIIEWEIILQTSAFYLYIGTYSQPAPSMLLHEKGWRAQQHLCPAAEVEQQQQNQCFPALGTVPALYFLLPAPDLSLQDLADAGKLTTAYSITNMKMI